MTIDGQPRPALLGDSVRWRRLLFDFPGRVSVQSMADAMRVYQLAVDTTGHALTLTTYDSTHARSVLSFSQPDRQRLIVDGTLAGHAIHAAMAYQDPKSFLLMSRGFNWIQELPFNR